MNLIGIQEVLAIFDGEYPRFNFSGFPSWVGILEFRLNM